MRLITKLFVVAVAFLSVGFAAHKFYVGIYQINFVPEKKMVQITTRIFLDDFNEAVQLKYKQTMLIGEPGESAQDLTLMKKYINEHFGLRINGKPEPMEYLSKDIEDNVLICYFRVTGVTKIKRFEVRNKILTDYVTEQQNIIQTNINGQKKSLLLTHSKTAGELTF